MMARGSFTGVLPTAMMTSPTVDRHPVNNNTAHGAWCQHSSTTRGEGVSRRFRRRVRARGARL